LMPTMPPDGIFMTYRTWFKVLYMSQFSESLQQPHEVGIGIISIL
jgi:hypothetical protein